ncbi:hypothetical protein ACQBAT_05115 [Ornithinimicrobium sp. Y1847]|uniref:hypothetical protein n=1 Tax=Ornithinimicrobium sp. Y1847 TaxID=3405419 RepID=UPI003CFFC34B
MEFDTELTDRYSRTLAGVFDGDVLINAEIARAGLGVPVVFEPNRKFYPPVLAAYEEAKAAEKGMFNPERECTFASRIDRYEQEVDAVERSFLVRSPEPVKAEAEEAVAAGAALLGLLALGEPGTLETAGLTGAELESLRRMVRELQWRAARVVDAADQEVQRKRQRRRPDRLNLRLKRGNSGRLRRRPSGRPKSAPQPRPRRNCGLQSKPSTSVSPLPRPRQNAGPGSCDSRTSRLPRRSHHRCRLPRRSHHRCRSRSRSHHRCRSPCPYNLVRGTPDVVPTWGPLRRRSWAALHPDRLPDEAPHSALRRSDRDLGRVTLRPPPTRPPRTTRR